MTPITGAISFSDINAVLGRTANSPISFSDVLVRKLLDKSTGQVSLNDAHACAYLNTTAENLDVHATLCGATTTSASFKVLIDTSAVVGATGGNNALNIGAFPASSTVTVNNYGSIQGHGGAGGGYYSGGGAGGTAINANYENVTSIINNHGSVYGGGGGGGAGGVGGTGGQGGGGYYGGQAWNYEFDQSVYPNGFGGSMTLTYYIVPGFPVGDVTDWWWHGVNLMFEVGNSTQCVRDGFTYGRGEYVGNLFPAHECYTIGQLSTSNIYTNGGAGGGGGAGGAGGVGQGYGQANAGGATGAGGAGGGAPETNAGWGGTGGTGGVGGTGGTWGLGGGAGATGDTGAVGGDGNNGGGAGGAVGQEGAGGGSAGLYLYKSDKTVTFNNLGTVLGGEA